MNQPQRHIITTKGKDGNEYQFVVEQDPPVPGPLGESIHVFRIRTELNSPDYFSFTISESTTALKIEGMSHNYRAEYSAKGIPEEIIRKVSEWFNKSVMSGSNSKLFKQPGQRVTFRTDDATKVWKRLEGWGEAEYMGKELDFYVYRVK